VLFARDPLFRNRKRDGAIAQEAGTHIMVVGIQAENVNVSVGHGHSFAVIMERWGMWRMIAEQFVAILPQVCPARRIAHCTINEPPVRAMRQVPGQADCNLTLSNRLNRIF
jgi:hypothetical protein